MTPNDTPDPGNEQEKVDPDLPGALGALVSAVLGDRAHDDRPPAPPEEPRFEDLWSEEPEEAAVPEEEIPEIVVSDEDQTPTVVDEPEAEAEAEDPEPVAEEEPRFEDLGVAEAEAEDAEAEDAEEWLAGILGEPANGAVVEEEASSEDATEPDTGEPADAEGEGDGDAGTAADVSAGLAEGEAAADVSAGLGEGQAESPPEDQDEPVADDEPQAQAEGKTLWHGRFVGGPAEELLAFTVSLPFDQRLAADDLAGCSAHVAGLARAGLITDAESIEIFMALDRVERELAGGTFAFAPSDEDIHTAIERRVTELAGDAGAKLHTGRSRNDQVATALRLWCKRELAAIGTRVKDLQRVLLDRAKEAGAAYLPGYTHLQRAQPVLLAHHLLAHGWALARDVDRLDDCLERLDVSPLGAGALAGSSLPLDPAFTADQLGFSKTFANSLDAVSDRDFVAEALFVLSLLAVHISRMGEEIVLWTTDEFGFARLDDAYATGSSMLPQKKNADIAELARGKAGRVIGDLTGLLTTLKGLPLAYNRDLQEDKEPLFDAVDQVSLALGAMAGLYRTITFDTKRMQEAADTPYLAATDLAEWLVQQGMPFRTAHAVVGNLVREALSGTGPLGDLAAIHGDLGPKAADLVRPGVPVKRRTTPGGGGPDAVAVQLKAFEQHLDPEDSDTP